MKIALSDKINFGWQPKTHGYITEKALLNFPKLRKYSSALISTSSNTELGLDDSVLFNPNSHFYFGRQLFFKEVPKEAFSFYLASINNSKAAFLSGKTYLGAIEAGNALHFLQDVSSPLHSQEKFMGLTSETTRKKFEKLADKKSKYLEKFMPKITGTLGSDFEDIFFNCYKKSSTFSHPFEKENRNKWNLSAKKSLALAYESTYIFLDALRRFLNENQ